MHELYRMTTLAAIGVYGVASGLYALLWVRSNTFLRRAPIILVTVGMLINLLFLIARWQEGGRPPFKTLYEVMVLFSGCIALIYVVVEVVYGIRGLGVLAACGCTGAMLYAWWIMDKEVVRIPPALQSAWFIPHVVVYFLGYAALFIAFIAAIVYLIRPVPLRNWRADLAGAAEIDLEKFANGAMRFGFALLTAGLLMGAFWAKSAWGDYWVWDPKESWSLVSWLIYVIILHLRYLAEWRGRRFAVLLIVGFAAVMFTYLGMNLLPSAEQSLHVYQ